MANGRFITIEGIEGVGKSTHLAAIEAALRAAGQRVVMSREPGGTPLGEAIRSVLLDPVHAGMTSDAELLLMFAARAQHLDKVIRPNVDAGAWVVSDRFTDATYAYQGGGREIDVSRIAVLEQWVQRGFQPDATLLLDAPVALAMKRVEQRGNLDRFEQEQHAFFERVRSVYLARAALAPQRYHIVDATRPLAEVSQAVAQVVQTLLARWA